MGSLYSVPTIHAVHRDRGLELALRRLPQAEPSRPLLEEAVARGTLTPADIDSLRLLDFIVRGRDRQDPAVGTVLAAEVSGAV